MTLLIYHQWHQSVIHPSLSSCLGHQGLDLLKRAALGLHDILGSEENGHDAGEREEVVDAAHADHGREREEELPHHEVAAPVGGHGEGNSQAWRRRSKGISSQIADDTLTQTTKALQLPSGQRDNTEDRGKKTDADSEELMEDDIASEGTDVRTADPLGGDLRDEQ